MRPGISDLRAGRAPSPPLVPTNLRCQVVSNHVGRKCAHSPDKNYGVIFLDILIMPP
ncbi:hypothetical protein PAXRUDRAFT_824735 [Paxillus rubicundulus Ve08.2h10]|uniref:Uncharacterized protein n=1 Tax=Paxillus rubicundulus Ve08.2h10 TaxID=930991 RepID=A0A0D0DU15_9AGAM|nr:hypothetical protein PAXRUDRAFT_824735 [Paxillus rubicundulus Ve08.2h10]